jgi:hypothetical protein
VQEAWSIGQRAGLDPTLILAIMAVESSFNPFAQSTVGAQGSDAGDDPVHDDKYQAFGGTRAAFDPITNLRVGVQVLKECIARAGSLQEGLRFYVGAAHQLSSDGGYADKVLAEQAHMRKVADGRRCRNGLQQCRRRTQRRSCRRPVAGNTPRAVRRTRGAPLRQSRRSGSPAALNNCPARFGGA